MGRQVAAYLDVQLDAILRADAALRSPTTVIQPAPKAVRRAHSTLSVFAKIFLPQRVQALRAELDWFAALLSPVVEAGVLADRMAEGLVRLPKELTFSPAPIHVQLVLEEQKSVARQRLLEVVQGERYEALLQDVERWRATPPFSDRAKRPAGRVKGHVEKAHDQFRRGLKGLSTDAPAERFGAALRDAERLRDAVEASVGAVSVHRLAGLQAGAELYELLREHRVSALAAHFLGTLGAESRPEGDLSGFTYGVLLERELRHAREIRQRIVAS